MTSFISSTKHNDELECLRATIAREMEQEKETAHHNCELVSKR